MAMTNTIRDRHPVTVDCSGDQGRTHAEFQEECDINNIVNRWKRNRVVTHIQRGQPWYDDFASAGDYRSAIEACRDAQAGFDALPAAVRAACLNDPALFLEALGQPDELKNLVSLGLDLPELEPELPPAPEPPPAPAPAGNDNVTEPPAPDAP